MADEEVVDQQSEAAATDPRRLSGRMAVALVVLAVFAGLFAAKVFTSDQRPSGADKASVTSVRNDASADYQAAAKSGKPIYVLFHSLS